MERENDVENEEDGESWRGKEADIRWL